MPDTFVVTDTAVMRILTTFTDMDFDAFEQNLNVNHTLGLFIKKMSAKGLKITYKHE